MAAPKGNKNALGNKGGRPLLYKDHIALAKACDQFFSQANTTPTIAGLILALGFNSKATLYNYRNRVPFDFVINRALTKIEHAHEIGLHTGACSGHIFALKNRGWNYKSR